MRPIFVDIGNELSETITEARHLQRSLARIDSKRASMDEQDLWEFSQICASATEKIYTGFELAMSKIASEIDRATISHADGWHISLLLRMANPYPGIRGAVITVECYKALDRLRAFRHRERNMYGHNFDFDIVLERAKEAISAIPMFQENITSLSVSLSRDEDRVANGLEKSNYPYP